MDYEEILRAALENLLEKPSKAVSKSLLRQMEVRFYAHGNKEKETHCVICSEQYKVDDLLLIVPKCNHEFHKKCVETWFKKESSCPLCRKLLMTDSETIEMERKSKKEKEEARKEMLNSMYM